MKLKTMTMEWTGDELILIDQRKIPLKEEYMSCKTYKEVALAIKEMVVRGAPAIGASAAFGYVLGAREKFVEDFEAFVEKMREVKEVLANTRPTAVNLFWALNRMENALRKYGKVEGVLEFLENEALNIAKEDIEVNMAIGRYGAQLLKDGDTVLTHCNAGALATVDYGTALGVIRAAVEQGKRIKVFADETRPYLQGARLTAWELMKDGIDVTLISDNMSGWAMKLGKINAVIVGADRVASNGDVANKIGTYMVAVLAKRHGIPFYVAAPTSTIDLNTQTGKDIPIEERKHTEVTHCGGTQIAPDNVKVFNPAFDVTNAELITAIITEKGIVYPPYEENLKKLFEE
ncbi:methylthioribose-1-phosphate isomerase [Thermosipho melanesiensis]|uniref:Methylthioribose-1-phosphate isomerase n=2 Tax=Thermosipho melanesiensis TaxID=46541 RepID=MTNA_THEM4|nr:S-methyl-5-thioribose-1-phosphate isomerase [Thermosipho melanesiensis]A6LJM7.1 RecName: Full=Methylthioribose-1-phosphate isomerase; Short=M1Pi; Short=MTR-1-P isomerase; AltName: Full=S-methyl-5-thioribose-1-phosphate isomerase [Thermosipho melanesiensis BI429]ABR30128.1 putative translation initiation factor, aIF-2BI family [Thermosipho melanesiensis BI429]APT73325.1 methylthioribose-1-phosphate isomerase [Thermosipho melanesiensis]OOC38715.1 methylthioribose-1-phosphate isomerase [Thermos